MCNLFACIGVEQSQRCLAGVMCMWGGRNLYEWYFNEKLNELSPTWWKYWNEINMQFLTWFILVSAQFFFFSRSYLLLAWLCCCWMSCYRKVMGWDLVFPSLLLLISVKPLFGRHLVPLPSTLAEVPVLLQLVLMCFCGCVLYVHPIRCVPDGFWKGVLMCDG